MEQTQGLNTTLVVYHRVDTERSEPCTVLMMSWIERKISEDEEQWRTNVEDQSMKFIYSRS